MKPTICNSGTPPAIVECVDGYWLVKVNDLSEVGMPDRNHAYQLPNDAVYVLSHDDKSFVLLRPPGESGPTLINNTDDYLDIEGSGTYSVRVNINEDKFVDLIENHSPVLEMASGSWNGIHFRMKRIPNGMVAILIIGTSSADVPYELSQATGIKFPNDKINCTIGTSVIGLENAYGPVISRSAIDYSSRLAFDIRNGELFINVYREGLKGNNLFYETAFLIEDFNASTSTLSIQELTAKMAEIDIN